MRYKVCFQHHDAARILGGFGRNIDWITENMAEVVRMVAVSSPDLVRRFGNHLTVRKYWIEVDYPASPPPRFLRSG